MTEEVITAFKRALNGIVYGGSTNVDPKKFLSSFFLSSSGEATIPSWLSDAVSSDPELTGLLVEGLDKIFATPYGSGALLQFLPALEESAKSHKADIRKLAAKLVGRALLNTQAPGSAAAGQASEVSGRALPLLVAFVLADEDTGVSGVARAALVAYGSTGAQQALSVLAEPSLSAAVSSEGPTPAAALTHTRALELALEVTPPDVPLPPAVAALLSPLGGRDLLGALAALEVLRDLVGRYPGPALAARILARRGAELAASVADPGAESLLRAKAAQLLSSCAAAASVAGPEAAAAGWAGVEAVGPRLFFREDDAEFQEAVFDAIGESTAGPHPTAAASFVSAAPTALLAAAVTAFATDRPVPLRLAATHALASVLGAERELLGGPGAGPTGGWGPFLGPEGELAVLKAVYESVRGLRVTVAEALSGLIKRGSGDVRVAGYRLASALLRRPWAVGEVVGSPGLIEVLLDASAETGRQGSEFRHSCVSSLLASLRDLRALGTDAGPTPTFPFAAPEKQRALGLLQAIEASLLEARRGGPYGAARAAARGPEPQVATEQRM